MIIDFIFEYLGASSSTTVDDFKASDALVLNLSAYEQKQKANGNPRKFVRANRGVQNLGMADNKVIDDLAAMATNAKKAGDQVGVVCISGYSLGSIYAIRLALKLKEVDVKLTYIGVSDLPIFPFGYNPPIAGFPSMIPENNPVLLVKVADPPRSKVPPFTKGPAIDSSVKKNNYFQNEGNGMSPTKKNPRGLWPWWWSSNLGSSKEVHGSLENWNNIPMTVTFDLDDNKNHDEGDKVGRTKIAADIEAEFAKL